MLNDAANLIKKQIKLYENLCEQLPSLNIIYSIENKVKRQLRKEIKIRKYILRLIEQERGTQDANKKRDKEIRKRSQEEYGRI